MDDPRIRKSHLVLLPEAPAIPTDEPVREDHGHRAAFGTRQYTASVVTDESAHSL